MHDKSNLSVNFAFIIGEGLYCNLERFKFHCYSVIKSKKEGEAKS